MKRANSRSKRDWQCQECGHKMTLRQAEHAAFDLEGCPKCGGADIDMVAPLRRETQTADEPREIS